MSSSLKWKQDPVKLLEEFSELTYIKRDEICKPFNTVPIIY